MENYCTMIREYIAREIEVLEALDVDSINQVLYLIKQAFEKENTIYIFGNGGSAATASHFQNDFNKGVSEYAKKKFRFCCLNDNIATVMAIANDLGYENIFRFQLEGRLRPGDLVVAISGSGNSANILRAVEYAKEQGNLVIGLTGFTGGKLRDLADYSLHVPVKSMQITEDVHMIFDHLMMSVFYKIMCGLDHLKEDKN